ncbi:hypothetical protein GGD62_005732 [Bradyrhizobium sp. ERR14]|nr:hypothetical protein [Bradyrhizobium sp. ERR14]
MTSGSVRAHQGDLAGPQQSRTATSRDRVSSLSSEVSALGAGPATPSQMMGKLC